MKEIYVIPKGEGDGSLNSPCSLEKARELVRKNNKDMSSDIIVYLEGGTYHLTTPFVLTPEDSGTNGFNVCWRNKPEAIPVFSGAQTITNWSLHDSEKNIWKAFVSEGLYFEHLWKDGMRLHRAWSGWNPKEFKNTRKGVKVIDKDLDVSNWKNIEDIIVTKKFWWSHIPGEVQSIHNYELKVNPKRVKTYNVPKTAIGVSHPDDIYWMNHYPVKMADTAIENAYELLTDEGEWYLNRSDSTLFYKPYKSDDFNPKSELIYSLLKTFILLDGTEQSPINNIEIEGIRFEYSGGTKLGITAGSPTEPTSAITPKPENVLQINAGQSITVKSNTFLHIGADAIHFDLLGKDIRIIGNGFGDISRAAISLNQTNLIISEESKHRILPENAHKFFEDIEVSNNYVRYTGLDDTGAAIVYSEFSRNVKVFHNEIREVPTMAIRNGWRFLGWTKHAANIEYAWNKTSDVGLANKEDFGALYISCCDTEGSSIHHNFINGVGIKKGNIGIYLDVNVYYTKIYNNVCINMPQPLPNPAKKDIDKPSEFGGWMGLVICEHNEIFNNWTDSHLTTDISPPDKRVEPSPTNKFHNNYYHPQDSKEWPKGAREVMDKAGISAKYQNIKQIIDSELDKGYIPLDTLYTFSKSGTKSSFSVFS